MAAELLHLPQRLYGAIVADPPWRFHTYDKREFVTSTTRRDGDRIQEAAHYRSMTIEEIRALPVAALAADDCALFLWVTWPTLLDALSVIAPWGFEYKTCGFCWIKAHADQLEMFRDDFDPQMGNGYWTRSNSEACLLATRGNPKRLNADVRQAIVEPRREHSRKPSCVHERIERLVRGPYLELFARARVPGWDCWGDEVDRFTEYRRAGIDVNNPNPDGSDYHIMNVIDAKRECPDCGSTSDAHAITCRLPLFADKCPCGFPRLHCPVPSCKALPGCDRWPGCGCGTQSGPHTCEGRT